MQIRYFLCLFLFVLSNSPIFAQASLFGDWELVEAREQGRVFYAQRGYEAEAKEILSFTANGTYSKTHQKQESTVWEGDWEINERTSNIGFRLKTTNGQRVENPTFDYKWKVVRLASNSLQLAQLSEYGEERYVYTYYRKE